MKRCKIILARMISALVLALMICAAVAVPVSAIPAYKSGANGASPSYAGGKYYRHVMSIPLTGDGATDVLAVALSQLGYSESANNNSLSGVGNGWGNHTEYNWNIGDIEGDGYEMEWCASFCSWALLQGGATNHNSFNDACRKHPNDPNYIWREVGCPPWVSSLKNAGLYSLRGTYIPRSGDLIFFNRGNTVGHIALVVWCDGTRVYTIEGNTSDSAGIEGNGGGVYYKSYLLTNTGINGYGRLSEKYVSKPEVPKVDYSGTNKTAGLYITKSAFKISPPVDAGHPVYEEVYIVPKYEMFEVTGFAEYGGVTYAVIKHGTGTYYGKLNSEVLQVTASASAPQTHVCDFHFTYTNETHMDRCDGCGAQKNYIPHSFRPAYNDTQHYLQCACGYIKPRSYASHDESSYVATATGHKKACSCGYVASGVSETAHSFNIQIDGGYACVCGAEQKNGSVHAHVYGFTYSHETHMQRCECGAKKDYVAHDFQPSYDENEHFNVCWCGYKQPGSYGKHENVFVQVDGGHATGCSSCGYVATNSTVEHSYGFTYDATHHMDRCECDARINVVEHNFQPAYDENEHFLKCSCGYKKPRSYGAHEYNSYAANESGHIVACECGSPDPAATQTAHTFNIPLENGGYACVCGTESRNGAIHVHNYGFTYDATHHMDRCECDSRINVEEHDFQPAHDENQHFLKCSCGYVKPGSYGSHEYNSYVSDGDRHIRACSCGYVDPSATPTEHDYVISKDTESAHKYTCTVCQVTLSEEHTFNLNGETECACGEKKAGALPDSTEQESESNTVSDEPEKSDESESEENMPAEGSLADTVAKIAAAFVWITVAGAVAIGAVFLVKYIRKKRIK